MRRLTFWAPMVLVAAILVIPYLTPNPYVTVFLAITFIFAMLGLGLQLTFGAAGMIVLCQAAFYGLGAYSSALAALHWNVPFPLTIVVGMVGALVGGLIMAPIIKLKEVYFAMATFSFGAIVTILFREVKITGGVDGLPGIPPAQLFGFSFSSHEAHYYLAFGALVLQYFLFRRLLISPIGLYLNAIRQNESAARASGIPVAQLQVKTTLTAFAAAGAAGSLIAHIQGFINPDMFNVSVSLWLLGSVVVGGMHTMGGALLGALTLKVIAEYSRDFREYIQLVYGVMLVAFMTLIPRGLWSLIDRLSAFLQADDRPHRFLTQIPEPTAPPFPAGKPDEPLLETREMTRTFSGVVAVDKASMVVRRGEIHGLIGPNGAGKTSLLNVLSGFYRPTSGNVLWKGRSISQLSDHARAGLGIGRTFQSPQICPELSTLENALLGYYPKLHPSLWVAFLSPRRGFVEASARARWALEFVGLGEIINLKAGNVSYGQRKLLEIARALVCGPELLLLDEPAAGLTPAEVQAMGEVVKRIHRLGISVLIIEHNMQLMMDLCQQMTVLNFGQVIADGPPADIRKEPQVVAAYLGG